MAIGDWHNQHAKAASNAQPGSVDAGWQEEQHIQQAAGDRSIATLDSAQRLSFSAFFHRMLHQAVRVEAIEPLPLQAMRFAWPPLDATVLLCSTSSAALH